ncbi:hypothetical protein KKH27_11260, partial [bacterium]|nr:hypothetical protein [bacterium]MBU1984989.1 hypothetical protein [bacterium]
GGTFLTSDKVIEQIGGRSFTCNLAVPPVWSGTLPDVSPGAAYWIQNKHAAPWNYTYNASGVPLIQNLNTPEIQKIIPSAKETGGKTGAVRK